MSSYDIVIFLVILAFGVRSLIRGLVKEILSMIALVIGFLCARLFGPSVGGMLFHSENPWLADAGGYLVVFLIVIIAAGIASLAFKITFKKSLVGWLNRAGGFAFGVVKGAVIVSLILLPLKGIEMYAKKIRLDDLPVEIIETGSLVSPLDKLFEESTLATAVPGLTLCRFMQELEVCKELLKGRSKPLPRPAAPKPKEKTRPAKPPPP